MRRLTPLLALGLLACLDRDPSGPGEGNGTPELVPSRAWVEVGQTLRLGLSHPSAFSTQVDPSDVITINGTVVSALKPGRATLTALFPTGRRSAEISVVSAIASRRAQPVDQGLTDASLLGIWAADQRTVFAAGTDGVMLRTLDGGVTWSKMATGTGANFTAVWGSSATDVFAVGSTGTVVHWDGSSWILQQTPTTDALLDVFGLGPNLVYAVGVGVILAYDGVTWRRMPGDLAGTELWSIWGTNPNELLTVGQNGDALRWDGVRWRRISSPTQFVMFGLWGTSINDVYAAGIRGLVAHYDGVAWDTVRVPSKADFFAVWGRSRSDIMVVGNSGSVVSYNGVAWTLAPQAASIENLRAISFDQTGAAWVAGWSGTVIRRSSTIGWRNLVSAPLLLATTEAFDGTPYAVGAGGAAFRYRNGVSQPEFLALPTRRDMYGMATTASGEMIAVGDSGTILSSTDGSTWRAEAAPTRDLVRSVWADPNDPGAVFAVGAAGLLLRRAEGGWLSMPSPKGTFYRHVFGVSPRDVFAVGDSGTVVHFDGVGWTAMTTPTQARLRGIWGTAKNDLIAVGETGQAIRYDGRNWYLLTTGTGKELRAVAGHSPTEVYAVGEGGTLLRFNGSEWRPVTLDGAPFLLGLSAARTGTLVAVGSNRTLLRLVP